MRRRSRSVLPPVHVVGWALLLACLSPLSARSTTSLTPEYPTPSPAGAPAMTYAPDGVLYLALIMDDGVHVLHRTGETWADELVDSRTALWGSLCLDAAPSGDIHACFIAPTTRQLVHAMRTSAGWSLDTIPTVEPPYQHADLSVDTSGCPHVVFMTTAHLRRAVRTGTTWSVEVLPGSGQSGVSVDAHTAKEAIACVSAAGVQYVQKVGGVWRRQYVNDRTDLGPMSVRVVVDALGAPHFFYFAYEGYDLYHTMLDPYADPSAPWYTELVDAVGFVGFQMTAAHDSSGRVFVAYPDYTARRAKLAVFSSGEWAVEPLDVGVPVDEHVAVAIAPGGLPEIAFTTLVDSDYHVGYAPVRHMPTALNLSFTSEVIDSNPTPQDFASAFDRSGRMEVAYSRADDNTIRLCEPTETDWSCTIVDQAEAATICVAVDATDRVHLAYVDAPSSQLRYARRDSTGWQVEVVATDAAYLDAQGLVLDPGATPHLVYRNASGTLRRLVRGTGGWQAASLPHLTDPLFFAVGSDGSARAAGGNLDPAYAYETESGWQVEPLMEGGRTETLALDAANEPCLLLTEYVLNDENTTTLALATRSAGIWTVDPIDGGMPAFRFHLQMDQQAIPRVGWLDGEANLIKYAYREQGAWTRMALDRGTSGSTLSSLTDALARPHLAYVDRNVRLVYLRPAGPAYVVGQVLSADGAESAGAVNAVVRLRHDGLAVDSVFTAADGSYLMAVPGRGRFTVEAAQGTDAGSTGSPQEVVVDREGQAARVDLELAATSAAVGPAAGPALRLSASPNPARGEVTIGFALPAAGPVRVDVFDLAGSRVAKLVNRWETAGTHTVTWRGVDATGARVAAGVYWVRIATPGQARSRKIVFVR